MGPIVVVVLALVALGAYGIVRLNRRFERAAAARAEHKARVAERQREGRLRGEVEYVLTRIEEEIDRTRAAADPDPAVSGATPGSRVARLEEIRGVLRRSFAPRRDPFPVSGPCAEVIESFRATAGDDRDLLYSESGDGRWLQVLGDRDLLRWAVAELFANTVRHAGPWSRISILAEPVEGAVLLTVRDDGVGLDATGASRLYSPFTPAAAASGLGLGLYAVRRMVEVSGGTIEARSAPGGGLLHRLRLPAAPQRAAREAAADARDSEAAAVAARAHSPNDS